MWVPKQLILDLKEYLEDVFRLFYDFECLSHPAYSLDLAPCNYHVSALLKEMLGGKKFNMDEESREVLIVVSSICHIFSLQEPKH